MSKRFFIDKFGRRQTLWNDCNGDNIPFSKITHQHWCNIYWYHRFLYEFFNAKFKGLQVATVKKHKYDMDFSLAKIEKKFGGEILDWVPKHIVEKRIFNEQSTRRVLIEKYQPQYHQKNF